ncbi:MAG: hypothetical protein LBV58_03000 [Acholeplasmatales bacterium]|jgi:hypothetical protein|nr:hypothetical protein [Acholeplasmatales bacterium]
MLYDSIFNKQKFDNLEVSSIDLSVLSLFDNYISKSNNIFGCKYETEFKVSSKWAILKHHLFFYSPITRQDIMNIGYCASQFELFLQQHSFVCNFSRKPENSGSVYSLAFSKSYSKLVHNPHPVNLNLNDIIKYIPNFSKKTNFTVVRSEFDVIIENSKKKKKLKNDELDILFSLGALIKYVNICLEHDGLIIKNIEYDDSLLKDKITIKFSRS